MKMRGFSIVEVVILIAVLGILLSIGVLSTNQLLVSGRDEERKSDAQTIVTNLESFYTSGITNVGSTQSITNMAPNPSVEVDTSSFTPTNVATISRSSTWSADGNYSLMVTPTSGSSTDSFVGIGGGTGDLQLGMQAGSTYTIQAMLHIPSALTGTIDSRAGCILAYWNVSGNYQFEKVCGDPEQAGTYHLSMSFTIPSDATEAFIRLYNGALSGGGVVYYDSIMLVSGNRTLPYLDGNSPNWSWTGTAGTSTSSGVPMPPTYFVDTYPNISITTPGYLTSYLQGVDTRAFMAPGIEDTAETFVAAINSVQTTDGVLPQPTHNQYVYQPIDSDGELCTNNKCRKFNLYYKLESDNAVHKVTGRHQ